MAIRIWVPVSLNSYTSNLILRHSLFIRLIILSNPYSLSLISLISWISSLCSTTLWESFSTLKVIDSSSSKSIPNNSPNLFRCLFFRAGLRRSLIIGRKGLKSSYYFLTAVHTIKIWGIPLKLIFSNWHSTFHASITSYVIYSLSTAPRGPSRVIGIL